MFFDFGDQSFSSFSMVFASAKASTARSADFGGNGKGRLIAVMIRGREERRARLDICQRRELQVGKSIRLDGGTLDDHIRTGSNGR